MWSGSGSMVHQCFFVDQLQNPVMVVRRDECPAYADSDSSLRSVCAGAPSAFIVFRPTIQLGKSVKSGVKCVL